MTADLARLLSDAQLWLAQAFIVFLRVGGAMALMPAFGEQIVPARVRLVAAFAFTLVTLSGTDPVTLGAATRTAVSPTLLSEMGVGLAIGAMLRLFVLALQTAGMMIAHFLILQGRKNKVFVPEKFRLSAWLAWILAFILSQLTKSAIPSVTAILFGFVLYIVFYYVLDIKLNIHKESLENPVNGEVWDMPTSKEVAAQIAQQEKAAQEK